MNGETESIPYNDLIKKAEERENVCYTGWNIRNDPTSRNTVRKCDSGGKVEDLDLRLDLWNHSPTGFSWGFMGSGPAQLALAILADFLGDDQWAVELHQHFKSDQIAVLPHPCYGGWRIYKRDIVAWLKNNRIAHGR